MESHMLDAMMGRRIFQKKYRFARFQERCFTCTEAYFSIIIELHAGKTSFWETEKPCFHVPLFCSRCFIIFGAFLDAFAAPAFFWSLCRFFGVLVSSCWVPLACLSCLWALSAIFCNAFGSFGLSVGCLCHFWANLGAICLLVRSMFYYCLANLGGVVVVV